MASIAKKATGAMATRLSVRKSGVFGVLRLARQRRHLASLDPHLLKDLGIDPHAAQEEARRPFWDVPAHWRG